MMIGIMAALASVDPGVGSPLVLLEGPASAESRNASDAGAGTRCFHGGPITDLGCINTYKVDSQIFSTMITSGIVGILCLAAFCFLQTFISVYRGRLLSPQVAIKPPVYTGGGLGKYFYWIWVTLSLREKELLATAGMDALMFERLIVFGLQLMAPVTILSCAVLIPVHASSRYLATSNAQLQSNLMGLTLSNMYPGSATLWLHFTFVWGYCLYAMWLLDRHYQWYVLLRQQYITDGDSISTWLRYMPKQQPQGLRNDSVLADMPGIATQQELLNPASGYARCTRSEAGAGPAEAESQLAVSAADVSTLQGSGLEGLSYSQPKQRAAAGAAGVQLAEIRPKQQQVQQPMGQSVFASAMSADSDLFDPASTNASSSPADSRYVSRQSSLKTLLPGGKLAKSSSQHLHPHAVTFTPAADTGCLESEEAGADSNVAPETQAVRGTRSTRSSATGFAEHLKRIGSFGRKASSGYSGLELQQEWQRRQRQHQQQRAAAAAAVAAAEQLGADAEWWAHKTGDPLLDRHVVQVDIDGDLAWSEAPGPSADRLHLWWELAPADANTAAPTAEAGSRQPGRTGSNISAVPGTCLLFDKRSLRARKPSVRFRNTVHVQSLRGNLLPLHVSNYAVLVTDVPGCEGSYAADDDEYADEQFARNRKGLLSRILQATIWGWPCLLSQEDLNDLSSVWHSQSFRVKSMQVNDSMQQLLLQQQQQGQQQHEQQQEAASVLQPPGQQAADSRQQPRSTCSTLTGGSNQQVSGRQRLVEQTFKQLFKDDLHAVIPVRDFQAVDELLRQWDSDLQKYIQARALLQLRIERERRSTASGFYLQEQRQRRTKSSFTASSGAGVAPILSLGAADDRSGSGQQLKAAMPGLSIRTDWPVQQESVSAAEDSQVPRARARLSHSTAADANLPAHPDGISLSGAVGGSFAGSEEVCRTPRLAPLKPHPVIPEKIMTRPRLVTRDEGEGVTAFGKVCSAVVGVITPGKSVDQVAEVEISDDVTAVAQRLEEQRQALVDLEASILEAQKEVLLSADTGSFIVLFKTPAAATLAARSSVFPQSSNSLETFKVQPAPGPEDMLWQNLWKTPSTKRDESLRCLFWYALLYLVPTGIFTAALNNISYSICNSETVAPKMAWFCASRWLQFLFTIILPMVLLMLWQNAVIPSNLYKLELRRGAAVSLSGMEHNILLIYVGWELVNLFLGGVLSASLTSQIKILTDSPDQWATLLGAAFPNSSNFFLNYVIARAFMMNLFRLIMPHGGMWRWIGQMLFTGAASFNHAATERYRSLIIYPASIRYGREPGLILLILLMGVAYSVAAPLITPFVLAYFCTAYLVWRYQMIHVCVRCYESGGKMWPVYFVIVLWCLGLFVVFSSCILIFKQANLQGVLLLPLLPALYMFARYCKYTYSSRVEYPPLWLAHEAPRTEIDPLVYTPPCLQPHAQGWYFEMGKAWVRWGAPAYMDPSI